MARTEDPREQAGAQVPEQRAAGQPVDPAPRLTVIGRTENQIALRLGWRPGMVTVSQSRFRFMRDDLGMNVTDEPENYLF
jgi:hypothetical protein